MRTIFLRARAPSLVQNDKFRQAPREEDVAAKRPKLSKVDLSPQSKEDEGGLFSAAGSLPRPETEGLRSPGADDSQGVRHSRETSCHPGIPERVHLNGIKQDYESSRGRAWTPLSLSDTAPRRKANSKVTCVSAELGDSRGRMRAPLQTARTGPQGSLPGLWIT